MFTKFWHIILASLLGATMTSAWAQAVTVVEYYNKTLDAYFITGRTAEQQQLDALTDFKRTGMSFQAVSANTSTFTTRICRFYISTSSPFTSSHFYGREGTDCELILARNPAGFSYEGFDFAVEQPTSGACPSTLTTIYRSFRPGANGKTSNHRYSASAESYIAAGNAGYNGEQAAFCVTAATDVTPPVASPCGTFYYPGVRVSYQSLTDAGTPNSWVRYNGPNQVAFNGRQATPVVDRYASSPSILTLIEEKADTWADLGTNTQDSQGTRETYFDPPTVFPRRMQVGQQIAINRSLITNPGQSYGTGAQTGKHTYVGQESISVDAGTYDACKFSSEITTTYATTGQTDLVRTTTWVALDVGIVKSVSEQTTTFTGNTTKVVTTTNVSAVSVQPL